MSKRPLPRYNETRSVSLVGHVDDIPGTCFGNAPDAAYRLDLDARSDVLLVGRISQSDYGAVSLFGASCDAANLESCAVTSPSPVRTSAHDLPPGTYHAVIETMQGNPTQLTAFVRPATPATIVVFADDCADVVEIPETWTSACCDGSSVTARAMTSLHLRLPARS